MYKQIIIISVLILQFSSCNKKQINENFSSEIIKLNSKGIEYGEQRKFDSAIAVFDRAISLDSTYYAAYGNKAAIYTAMKDFKKALLTVEKQVAIKPDFAEGWLSAATLSDKAGDSIKAMKYYQKSLDLYNQRIADPTKKSYLMENRINKDFLLIQLGYEKEAKADLQIIKHENPEIDAVRKLLKLTRKKFLESLEEK